MYKDRAFWIYVLTNNLSHNRLGISVSNKACVNIVQRNRIKRILKEIFRLNIDIFGQGVDIVIVLKQCPEQINYSTFLKTIETCLNTLPQIRKK